MAEPALNYERPKKIRRMGWFRIVVATFVAMMTFVGTTLLTFAFTGILLDAVFPGAIGSPVEVLSAGVALFLSYCVAAMSFRAFAANDSHDVEE